MSGLPVGRFDDLRAGTALQFSRSAGEIIADEPGQVRGALEAVSQANRDGLWAFGFVAYEAALGGLPVRSPQPGLPLVWFGLSEGPDADPGELPRGHNYQVQPWSIDWSESDHAEKVARVRAAIAAGDTYQCNLTTRMRSRVTGDLLQYYADLARTQRGSYHAFLDLGRWAVLSASPECFLKWDDAQICSVPMKGTARRGATSAADEAARAALASSAKERAENLMIVDLIRNDLAQVSEPGTVRVPELFSTEKFPTLWQLTSTVTAQPRPEVGLPELFEAMFPCGSVTGAPKRSTMSLIAELEDSPRGVYCGTIGYLPPSGRGSFNVAIRTVVVDRDDQSAVYGVGGGVTWDSTAAAEYQELLTKARLLDQVPDAEFALLETLALRDSAPVNLEWHLSRLADSSTYFEIPFNRAAIELAIAQQRGTKLLRLVLRGDGSYDLQTRPLLDLPEPVRLALDTVPVDPNSPFVHHKTTRREHYQQARERHPQADDVVLVNPAGQVTETTIANLAVRLGSTWFTPPVSDGCLPGVGRALALASGKLVERSISTDELLAADEVALVSSARGWRRVILKRP